MSSNNNPQSDNNTRLEALFGALRQRDDLLKDDEIRNIVHAEARQQATYGRTLPQKQGVAFPQRLFTRKFMLVSSILASILISAVVVLTQFHSSQFNAVPKPKSFPQQRPSEDPNTALQKSRTPETPAFASLLKKRNTQTLNQYEAVAAPTAALNPSAVNAVEGTRFLELNDVELLKLGFVVDSLGGIHQMKKRPPTGLERRAYTALNKPIQELETRARLDFMATLPSIAPRIWYAAMLGKPYQKWCMLGDSLFQAELRNPENKFILMLPRNKWNAVRVDSVWQIQKEKERKTNNFLANVIAAEVMNEEVLLKQRSDSLSHIRGVSALQILFLSLPNGYEWLAPKAKTGIAIRTPDFTNEALADSLFERIEKAQTQEESDSAEARLRKLYLSPAQQRVMADSVGRAERLQRLEKIKEATPSSHLVGITVRRDTASVVLWCNLTSELVQLLPDRYRISLERELSAAEKYSSLCAIPTREEREELESIIAGKPFLEAWRSCAGALTTKPIAPNPAQHHANVNFSLSAARSVSVALHDIRGQHLETLHQAQSFSTGEHTLSVNLTKHVAGMYMLVLTTSRGEQTVQRLMVEE
ncbi:MAG: T9SS type A sorting domain-containing protein [Candidatus Kapaibacteriota bacterium]